MATGKIIQIPGQSDQHLIMQNSSGKLASVKQGYNLKVREANFAGRIGGRSDFQKNAAIKRKAVNIELSGPEMRNPLLNIVNFYLPQNYKVLNQWINN